MAMGWASGGAADISVRVLIVSVSVASPVLAYLPHASHIYIYIPWLHQPRNANDRHNSTPRAMKNKRHSQDLRGEVSDPRPEYRVPEERKEAHM